MNMPYSPPLPIDLLQSELLDSFEHFSNIILKASPGSGKTTRVPLFLLPKTSKKIYILEPRRLAAKLAALQVACALGENIGESVGYIFRFEKVISEKSRIIFLTEGTFLKILSQNKNLNDVGTIILDEFHERHLSTDAALGFVMKLQKESRPDLKVLVMSATIETDQLEEFLNRFGKTKTLTQEASRFDLSLQYLPNVTSIIQANLEKKVYNAVCDIFEKNIAGDILVFLPGMREIRDCEERLALLCEENNSQTFILHGDLDSDQQMAALSPSKNFRKIILSTNIAESSVTIPGIRIVIDSGLRRESAFNFFSGLSEIKLTKISRASATQRAGRANREGVGHCFHLYAELDFDQRPYLDKPEISKSDLSELYLTAIDLFKTPLENLSWLLSPPESALKNSRELLTSLGAISENFTLTPTGVQMLDFSLHPRFARMLVEGQKFNQKSYNNILIFLSDFLGEPKERLIKNYPHKNKSSTKEEILEKILLTGFCDRVARARGGNFFDVITMNGETLKISSQLSSQLDPNHPLWIVLDVNHKSEVSKCIAIEEDWLYDLEPFPISEVADYSWDEKKEQVISSSKTLIGKILLSESKNVSFNPKAGTKKILQLKAASFLNELKKSQEYERLLTLNKIVRNLDLENSSEKILDDFFNQQIHFNQTDREILSHSFFHSLKDLIDPENSYNLEVDFPMTISLSDRRKIPIIYDRTQDPSIESFIQDFYGLSKTPILAKGKIPLTLKLLGPHKRAIQVTQDLESFWSKTYPQMFKELTREYPRHHWPEDPKSALPILLKRQLPTK